MREICQRIPNCPVVLLKQTKVKSPSHILENFTRIERIGGEGLVITNPDSMYSEGGGRQKDRVKLKVRNDTEGIVVGHNLKKDGSELKSLIVQLPNSKVKFNLGIGFKETQRKHWRTLYPKGTEVSFSYRGLSKSGKPKEARFVRVRSDV